jgi:integrase/recombinase XerD
VFESVSVASLFNAEGQRKYLHAAEARRLLASAAQAERRTRLFCELLYYTGCRISEALELTLKRLDAENHCVVFRTLKRRQLVYRAVPVPTRLLHQLAALARECGPDERLFPWCRQTGWRRIKELMERAGIDGPQATPKGLRHQYGVLAIEKKVPEGTLQRWMGHARLRNTQIYTFVTGPEERALAERMW